METKKDTMNMKLTENSDVNKFLEILFWITKNTFIISRILSTDLISSEIQLAWYVNGVAVNYVRGDCRSICYLHKVDSVRREEPFDFWLGIAFCSTFQRLKFPFFDFNEWIDFLDFWIIWKFKKFLFWIRERKVKCSWDSKFHTF